MEGCSRNSSTGPGGNPHVNAVGFETGNKNHGQIPPCCASLVAGGIDSSPFTRRMLSAALSVAAPKAGADLVLEGDAIAAAALLLGASHRHLQAAVDGQAALPSGGALALSGSSLLLLAQSRLLSNRASGQGGGVFMAIQDACNQVGGVVVVVLGLTGGACTETSSFSKGRHHPGPSTTHFTLLPVGCSACKWLAKLLT